MKANELRIGNWLNRDGKNFQVVVIDITETNSITKSQPIPLTEKWLLKFGLFKIHSFSDKWNVGHDDVFAFDEKIECSDFFIKRINDLFYFMIATIDDGNASSEFLSDLDYVHNFQNLCFALKGEELTLNIRL